MKISLWSRHALIVEDGAISQKILEHSTLHYWFKSYGNFAKLVDFAYWWSFSSEGFASAAYAAGLFYLIYIDDDGYEKNT